MSTRRIEVALWTVAAVLALIAARGWRASPNEESANPAPIPVAVAGRLLPDGDSLEADAAYTVEHDPFRLERRPSDVPYVPGIESAPPPPPEPPKPVLVLTGIMGGPPWQGVLEGLPGTGGSTVVREGQLVGELRVVRVTREEVVVEGADTTWTLRVRRTW